MSRVPIEGDRKPSRHPEVGSPIKVPASAPGSLPDEFRHAYPLLWAHLTQGRDADGMVRQTSTLLLFLEGGRLKMCLHDRQKNSVAFLSVSGLPQGFGELEDGLARGTLDWRVKRSSPIRRTK